MAKHDQNAPHSPITPQQAALLRWQIAAGIDETIEETPQNRFAELPSPALASEASQPETPVIIQKASSEPLAHLPAFEAMAKATALASTATTLAELRAAVEGFRGLAICRSATMPVFAQGVETPQVMVLGEAPGADEDRSGVPFCGKSGQLLDKMLAAIGLDRKQNAYISNVIFWRPPGNRTPNAEEIATCRPFVEKHIALLDPPCLFLLGSVAVKALLDKETALGKLRGSVYSFQNPANGKAYPVHLSYHPSYLLRSPQQKKLAWQDLLALKASLPNQAEPV